MKCVHCGAELSDREEICTLCGKLAKVPDAPETPAKPPAAAPEQPVTPEQPAAPTEAVAEPPAAKSADTHEGAAFCTECSKYVYLDANGCCDQGHPVSSMTDRGTQIPDTAARPVDAGNISDLRAGGLFANNSGQGAASTLPPELEGVNWGAFLLTWIWGIANRVWLSFLVFFPGGNTVMPWVLLIKGNEWAWKNRQWGSIQEFQEVQRKWAIAGIVLTVLMIALFCMAWVLLASLGTVGNTPQSGARVT